MNKKTSEEIHGIDKQPKNTCPILNNILDEAKSIRKDAKAALYSGDLFNLESFAVDVELQATHISEYVEDARSTVEDIRAWGEQWKQYALFLMGKSEIEY